MSKTKEKNQTPRKQKKTKTLVLFTCKDIVSTRLELIWKGGGTIGPCPGVLHGFESDTLK